MKQVKNFFIGFLVSFVGSIPLGYLNIIGFQIYQKIGFESLIRFILGVISIELFVIYFTLIFAKRVAENIKLKQFIDVFSIVFMLLLAYIFYYQANKSNIDQDGLLEYIDYSPFLIGIVLNSFNFMQLPFWTSWNLYLLNRKFILLENKLVFFYLAGTSLGILLGMLLFVLGLDLANTNLDSFSGVIFSVIIPLFFLAMAIIQTYRYFKK